jgi:hypothetical protein
MAPTLLHTSSSFVSSSFFSFVFAGTFQSQVPEGSKGRKRGRRNFSLLLLFSILFQISVFPGLFSVAKFTFANLVGFFTF